ncbi:MAG: ABC transporter substrate-binding protein [Rhodothermales bacterium]
MPRDGEAELVFEQAVEAFEEGDYSMAYRRFRLVYDSYPINRKTTAAMLMAGKSLYREGRYQEAVDLLDALIRLYPTSSYHDEANRVREFALDRLRGGGESRAARGLGILLPADGSDAALTQAIFTGIRIAVEEHNSTNPNSPVRMVFRRSGADPQRAAEAVAELAQQGVEAIIGPLYSTEAVEAARAAERAGVVMIAPLANDEAVSEGRRFVFQANSTIMTHGRLMARFGTRSLMLDDFGIIAERDREQISERMAEGFQEEANSQGADVEFFEVLRSTSDWSRLSEVVGPDSMARVTALYLPFSGGEAASRIEGVFTSLDRMNLAGEVRVLGNSEWHGNSSIARAARYQTTYTLDFNVDAGDAAVQSFMDRFRQLSGRRADPTTTTGRLGFTGYDVSKFLLAQLTRSSSRSLRERLRDAPAFQGLGIRIDFRNGNVNEALYYFRYYDDGVRLLR